MLHDCNKFLSTTANMSSMDTNMEDDDVVICLISGFPKMSDNVVLNLDE